MQDFQLPDEIGMQPIQSESQPTQPVQTQETMPTFKENPYKVNIVTSRIAKQKTMDNIKFLNTITGGTFNL